MSHWRILGRCVAAPLPADWREQLLARLATRPRRLGHWCETGLFGALTCLAEAGEARLPADALLSVSTLHGPDQALLGALKTAAEDGLPMPMGFLQSQPGQLLAHFSALTGWQGDARMLASRDPLAPLRQACRSARSDALMLGWLDEGDNAMSIWLRLQRCEASPEAVRPPASLQAFADPAIRVLRLG